MAKSDIGRFDAIGPLHYGGWWPEEQYETRLDCNTTPYDVCPKCNISHGGALCPFITAIEYHPNGTIKRIEWK